MVLGALATLGMGIFFLAFMSDQLRNGGAGGPGPLVIVTLLGAGMFAAMALGPIGRAVGKRILEGGDTAGSEAAQEDLNDLRFQVDEMRQALAETQERLDFTERMLASGRERAPEELH